MAITIVSGPTGMVPAFGPEGTSRSAYVVDSTVANWTGMKYVADLWAGSPSSKVARLKLSPNTSDLKCVVDVQRVLSDLVGTTYPTDPLGPTSATRPVPFFVVFGEETDGTPGGTGATFSVALGPTSQTCWAWDGVDIYGRTPIGPSHVATGYDPGASGGMLLTDAPSDREVQSDESELLRWVAPMSTSHHRAEIRIRVVGPTGSTSTYYVDLGAPSGATLDSGYVGYGPADLNAMAASGALRLGATDGTTVTPPVIPCGALYVEAAFTRRPPIGSPFTVAVASAPVGYVPGCCTAATSRHRPMRLRWLNRLGGVDTYTFRLASQETLEVERSLWSRHLSRYSSQGSGSYGYVAGRDRGGSVLSTRSTASFQCVSSWHSQAVEDWLTDLFVSTDVRLLVDGEWLPVIVTDGSTQVRTKRGVGNRLLSKTITVRVAVARTSQRS